MDLRKFEIIVSYQDSKEIVKLELGIIMHEALGMTKGGAGNALFWCCKCALICDLFCSCLFEVFCCCFFWNILTLLHKLIWSNFTVILPQPPMCWDYRQEPLCHKRDVNVNTSHLGGGSPHSSNDGAKKIFFYCCVIPRHLNIPPIGKTRTR